MEVIDYKGWPDSVRLANKSIELVVLTAVGPRIIHASSLGGPNLMYEDAELAGKVGPADTWVNYGGHRLWHAPEVFPRTYAPDNSPVEYDFTDNVLTLTAPVEPSTGMQKGMRISVPEGDSPTVLIEHTMTNRNPWEIECAAWALTVVAQGGRVIFPQEPFSPHGADNKFLPVRPVVLWSFTDMADSRWTWGSKYVQLRSDASIDLAQKFGIFNSPGWAAYARPDGNNLIIFTDPDPAGPEAYPDFGCNYETFTKADFQELETLGPTSLLGPDETVTHVEYWAILKDKVLPDNDSALASVLPAIISDARQAAYGLD
jgi:hypothetical protein